MTNCNGFPSSVNNLILLGAVVCAVNDILNKRTAVTNVTTATVAKPKRRSTCIKILLALRYSARRFCDVNFVTRRNICQRELCYAAPSFNLFRDHSATGRGSRIGLPRFGQLSAYSPVSE